MHPRLEELLAVRDGEASRETVEHVEHCAACQDLVVQCLKTQERLKALPVLRPEHSALPGILEAAALQRAQRRWVAAGWAAACLAMAFTLTTGVRGGIEAYREAKLASETRALVAESQRLERDLRLYSAEGRLQSGTTAAVIADLQDRIATVDARLQLARSRPTNEVVELWQERVHLLGTLADLQTTRTTYVGL